MSFYTMYFKYQNLYESNTLYQYDSLYWYKVEVFKLYQTSVLAMD